MSQIRTTQILAQLRELLPNARSVKKLQAHRTKRDDLPAARCKTAKKLRDNIARHAGHPDYAQVDPVYKLQPNELYAVGIKYGNRFLKDAIGDGTYVPDVPEATLAQLLELLATQVEAGLYDDAIGEIMQANVNARNSTKH